MDDLLALIIPPIVGLITYIVLRCIAKPEIDILRHLERDESSSPNPVRLHDPSADLQTETGRVYATASESIGRSVVGFEDRSVRRRVLHLVTLYQRTLTRWRKEHMIDVEKQKKIEKRLAATISRSTPAKPNRENAEDRQSLEGLRK
jgi:hypothetical protein